MSLAEAYLAAMVCRILDLPRSTFSFRGRPGEDDPLKTALLDLAGRPVNGKRVRRLLRTIKEEVDLTEYEDLAEARRQRGRFLDDVDNTKRIHSSQGHLIPAEFEEQSANRQQTDPAILS